MSVDRPDPAELAELLAPYAGVDWSALDPIESRRIDRLAVLRVAPATATLDPFRPELFGRGVGR